MCRLLVLAGVVLLRLLLPGIWAGPAAAFLLLVVRRLLLLLLLPLLLLLLVWLLLGPSIHCSRRWLPGQRRSSCGCCCSRCCRVRCCFRHLHGCSRRRRCLCSRLNMWQLAQQIPAGRIILPAVAAVVAAAGSRRCGRHLVQMHRCGARGRGCSSCWSPLAPVGGCRGYV